MEVADLRVKFSADGQAAVQAAVRKTDADIKSLANNSVGGANRVGSAFAGAGRALAIGFGAVAAIGIGKAVSGFININAQAEQFHQSLEIVTGSQEKANVLFDKLQGFAAATPFEFPELVQASINLEAFGLSTDTWIGTIGDTASAMGKSVDQVTQAVLDAGSGQFERMKELGIQGAIEGDKLKLSYMENGKQIVETVDKNNKEITLSTIQAIWNKKYAGAMAKQSKTFNGMLSTFKDNVKMKMAAATKSIFEFSKDGLDAANRFFDRFNDKRALGLGVWAAAMSSLHTTLDQVFGKSAGDAIIGVIRGIGSAVSGIVSAIGDLGGALFSGDISGFFSLLGQDLLALANATIVKLPAIAVEIGGWLLSSTISLYDKVTTWARSFFTQPIDLGPITVNVSSFPIALASGISNIKNWGITAQTLFGIGEQFGEALRSVIDNIDLSNINWMRVAEVIGISIAAGIAITFGAPILIAAAITTMIAGAVKGVIFPDASFAEIGTRIKSGITNALTNISVSLASWALKLPLPSISGITGSGLAMQLPLWISGAVTDMSDVSVSLASWALKLPLPKITGITGTDLAMQGPLWISGAVSAMSDVSVSLISWTLKLPTPSFPDLANGALSVLDWIEQTIDGFGDINFNLLSWNINLPVPSFPDLSRDWVTNAIRAVVAGFGPITVPISNAINWVFGGEGKTPEGGKMAVGPGAAVLAANAAATAFTIPAPDFTAFTAAMTTVATQATAAQTAVTASFVALRTAAQASATATASDVTMQFTQMRSGVTQQMNATASDVTSQFMRMSSGAMQQTNAMVSTVTSGFYAMQSSAISAASGLVGGVLGQLSVLPGAGYGIGASLGYGIASGIAGTINAVASAAASVVNAAVAAARAAGGIASPSKVMMQLGGYMTEGFALGMARGMPAVNRSMDGLVGSSVRSKARANASNSRSGGDTYIIIEKGSFVGRYAEAEIEQMVASGAVKVIDQRMASNRTSGRS